MCTHRENINSMVTKTCLFITAFVGLDLKSTAIHVHATMSTSLMQLALTRYQDHGTSQSSSSSTTPPAVALPVHFHLRLDLGVEVWYFPKLIACKVVNFHHSVLVV